jgi:hypothetical protein
MKTEKMISAVAAFVTSLSFVSDGIFFDPWKWSFQIFRLTQFYNLDMNEFLALFMNPFFKWQSMKHSNWFTNFADVPMHGLFLWSHNFPVNPSHLKCKRRRSILGQSLRGCTEPSEKSLELFLRPWKRGSLGQKQDGLAESNGGATDPRKRRQLETLNQPTDFETHERETVYNAQSAPEFRQQRRT